MYNTEQVSKVFSQNFSWNMPKNGLFFVVNPQNRQTLGFRPQNPSSLDSITRECAKTLYYHHWTFLIDADAWQFWTKRNLYLYFMLKRNLYFLPPLYSAAPIKGADIYRHCKQIQKFKKKWNVARNIINLFTWSKQKWLF